MSTQTAEKPKAVDPNQITLRNVRLSYPNLFTPKGFSGDTDGSSTAKYSASFLLDNKENAKEIAAVQAQMEAIQKEKKLKLAPSKLAMRSGTEKPGTDGYHEDMHFISASNTRPPQVVDRDRSPIAATDRRIYGGIYVNAVIRLWAQDNKFGKRINASLEAVQFLREGEPFGAPPVDVNTTFDEIPGDDGTDII